ncbi:peptidylprolyl isomerase [Candidatus Bathyarchaeota archaeon]|nr:peptidylprolyl isomerase [Candidatus Bathyarchaeota archaeon]
MPISIGDEVIIHYAMKLEDGKIVESTFGKDPFVLKVGSGDIPQGLEEALIGLRKGDKKTVVVPPEKGFGPRREARTTELPKSIFEEEEKIVKNALVEIVSKEGERHMVTVQDVKKDSVILNLNHPLAGETLVFDIEVVDVASDEDDDRDELPQKLNLASLSPRKLLKSLLNTPRHLKSRVR